jgi:hypothetical protein
MDAAELAANPLRAEYVIRDLNADPILPFCGLPRRDLPGNYGHWKTV